MHQLKKIIAICGSTRTSSSNLNLIKAISRLAKELFSVTLFEGLTEIPHFNPDLDNENPPAPVIAFRNQLRQFDGLLICTPEYAMGVPGTLKNAIDWTVSSMEFSHKPTVLITASSVGRKGHDSLLETLKIIEARISDETQLLIPFIRTKINDNCKITDDKTLSEITALIHAFDKILSKK